MAKVLAKEVAPFNIRVLTVVLGSFNTNMPNAVAFSKNPLPEDYKGSVADLTMQLLADGKVIPDGDKDKAVKVVYEVVMGEGFGAGLEVERLLPLGRDVAPRCQLMQDQFAHSIEVFGGVCNNVYVDK